LYVGITDHVGKRDSQHKRSSPWYAFAARREVQELSSRSEAAKAELVAIQRENPAFNSTGRSHRAAGSAMIAYTVRHSSAKTVTFDVPDAETPWPEEVAGG
jgi:hypothetical protein